MSLEPAGAGRRSALEFIKNGGVRSVGLGILDRDHQEMSETIWEVQTDLATGTLRSRNHAVLNRLSILTLAHFALEEAMMAAVKYPNLAAHQLRHQMMIREMNALVSMRNRARLEMNSHTQWFMSEWHAAHVHGDDLEFGLWLNGPEPS
jgi:hemerythrin-like metal-binding protein